MPSLTEKEIVDYIMACKSEVIENRTNIRTAWDNLEALYLGHIDWTQKEEWQFKVYPGQVWRTIKHGTSLMSRILVNTPRYFTIEGVEFPQDWLPAAAMEETVRFYFNRRQVKFISKWREAAESALLYGLGVLKWGIVLERNIIGNPRLELSCETVDPRDLLFPYDSTFHIHQIRKTIPSLRKAAEAGQYDKGRVTKLTNSDYVGGDADSEVQDRMARLDLIHVPNSYRRWVHLDEYWGDILDEKGRIVHENWRVVIANERHILAKGPNPYECGRHPFITINPLRVVFRNLGNSIFTQCEGHQVAMTDMLNLLLDSVLFRIIPMFEADINILEDPEDVLLTEPGKCFAKRGQGAAISQVGPLTDIPAGAMQLLQFLRQDIQNHTGITDLIMGMPTVKGSPTATEIAEKAAAAQAMFEQVSKDVEEQGIAESVSLAADLIVQMMSFGLNRPVATIFKDYGGLVDAIVQDPINRSEIYGGWQTRSRGITAFFEKREVLQSLTEFGALLLKGGPEMQKYVKITGFIERFMDALRLPHPEQLVKSEQEIQVEAQQQAQMQAMAIVNAILEKFQSGKGQEAMGDIQALLPMLGQALSPLGATAPPDQAPLPDMDIMPSQVQ